MKVYQLTQQSPYTSEWMQFIRRSSQVTRCHTLPAMQQHQNLAEHGFGVAHIVLFITDGQAERELLLACLQHDLSEAVTGDIPTPIKQQEAGLKTALDAVEAQINQRYNLYSKADLTPEARVDLKAADILDLMFYAQEQIISAGNQGFYEVLVNSQRCLRQLLAQHSRYPQAKCQRIEQLLSDIATHLPSAHLPNHMSHPIHPAFAW